MPDDGPFCSAQGGGNMLAGERGGPAPSFSERLSLPCRGTSSIAGWSSVIDFQRIRVHLSRMMIRDAIREFHDAIAMPVMAPIVIERPVASDAADRYEARTGARLSGVERNVVQFVAASGALARELRHSGPRPDDGSDVSDLTDFVDHLERMAERMAIDNARTEKDMLRDARVRERHDASLAAAHRRAAARLASLNAQIIETLLALALEVRALRSTLIEPNPSPVFDDADDLARYLDEAMRA